MKKKLILFVISSLNFLNSFSSYVDFKTQDNKIKQETIYNKIKEISLKNLSTDVYCNFDQPIRIKDEDPIISKFFLIEYQPFDEELFEILIKNSANKNLTRMVRGDKESLLIAAIKNENIKAVKILLENKANPNFLFPLIEALSFIYINFDICHLLIEYGADLNLIDKYSNTSFDRSVLISAVYNCLAYSGQLHYAENVSPYSEEESAIPVTKEGYKKYLEIIKILLKSGANPNLNLGIQDEDRGVWKFNTPYEFAKEAKIEDVLKIFDEYIVDEIKLTNNQVEKSKKHKNKNKNQKNYNKKQDNTGFTITEPDFGQATNNQDNN